MGCFLHCFGASKRSKLIYSANATPSTHQTHVADADLKVAELTEHKIIEQPTIRDTELKIKLEQQSNESGVKKITFDLNVNANEELFTKEESNIEAEKAEHEEVPQINYGLNPKAIADNVEDEERRWDEVNGKSIPEDSSESLFSLSIDSRKQVTATETAEDEVNSLMRLRDYVCNTREKSDSEAFASSHSTHDGVQKVRLGLNPIEEIAQGKLIKATAKENLSLFKTKIEVNFDLNVNNTKEESSTKELTERLNDNKQEQEGTAQIRECPKSEKSCEFWNYRYRDCCDEESGDFDFDGGWTEEETSESLFSLSIESRLKISTAEKGENEVNSPMPEARIRNTCSVLNAIENLTKGKVAKATVMQASKYEKENVNSEQDVNSNGKAREKKINDKTHKRQEEVRVDTSLSSWLVDTPKSNNSTNSVGKGGRGSSKSPVSREDRPILGALSIEELRKFGESTRASRWCKTPSPDETPIIGTVGSYWSHTNSESGSRREDAKMKWDSSSVKARLESAFDATAAQL